MPLIIHANSDSSRHPFSDLPHAPRGRCRPAGRSRSGAGRDGVPGGDRRWPPWRRVLGGVRGTRRPRTPPTLFELPTTGGAVTRRAILPNVRVLAEGVDLRAD